MQPEDGSQPLDDARHERFVNEIAKGVTKRQAATNAGFKSTGAHVTANRLLNDVKVQTRLAWLKRQWAIQTTITLASGTEAFLRLAAKAEALKGASAISAARACIFSAMEVNGLVVHRTEDVGHERITATERAALLAWVRSEKAREAREAEQAR